MISVQEAKDLILQNTSLTKMAKLPLADAAGYTLASDVTAPVDIPNFAQSSMDGYAIRFADSQDQMRIIGEMAAGTSIQLEIGKGQAARIFTGAPLPAGADTILMQEKANVDGLDLRADDPHLAQGMHVRAVGSEIKAGESAMASGTVLSPAAIGFLAGIGISDVLVFKAPDVALILTGNELQQPGLPLKFGQVYEANSVSLSAALKKAGIRNIALFTAADDPLMLQTVIGEALERNDVILLNGGVSVGDYDFVVEASQKCGIRQIFHKVKQKPGKPLFFGTKEHQLIFGLPGNPSSALTCFYEYVLPALEKTMRRQPGVVTARARLTHDFKKPPGLTHFVKATYADGQVTPLHAQESYRLHSFAQANAFFVVPETVEYCSAGEDVEVHLLPI